MVYSTQIGRFCDLNSNYEQLLCEKPYCVKTQHYYKNDKHYVMFTYNQVKSDFKNDIVRECRGIIFREGEWTKPVCHAFDKFGNYQESYVPKIDWNSAKVTEKVDGSLIKVWYNSDIDDYTISTNGTINAFNAPLNCVKYKNFGELFVSSVDKTKLIKICKKHKKQTYIFELVSPYNRIVVPYNETCLYFLGERNVEDLLTSFTDSECTKDFLTVGVKIPKVYNLSTFEDVVLASKELPWDEEGYVVHDKKNNRIKIKSPNYVLAHYARNNNVVTKKYLIDVILKGEKEEFLTYCADYNKELASVEADIIDYKNMAFSYWVKLKTELPQNYTRKEYAQLVNSYPEWVRSYLFFAYDKNPAEYMKTWNSSKWEKELLKWENG